MWWLALAQMAQQMKDQGQAKWQGQRGSTLPIDQAESQEGAQAGGPQMMGGSQSMQGQGGGGAMSYAGALAKFLRSNQGQGQAQQQPNQAPYALPNQEIL